MKGTTMDIVFDLPPALMIGLIVSTILPILTGLATTRVTNASVKAVILAALAAVTGLGTELLASIQSGGTYDLGTGLVLALTAFLVATAMHFGLWKPTTVADKAQALFSSNTVTMNDRGDGTWGHTSL
jgi:hypothetical protein